MIDWTRVSELRDEVGGEDFYEVVNLFLEEVEDVMLRLTGDPNPESRAADLHFLRGSAVSLGFSFFSELCSKAENSPVCNEADIDRILTAYKESKCEFMAGLQGNVAA